MTPEQAIKRLMDSFGYKNDPEFATAVNTVEAEISRLNDLVQGAMQEAPNPDDANEGVGNEN